MASARFHTFQSTHPRGVRPGKPQSISRLSSFNPRTPVGCDLCFGNATEGQYMFQSTHPRGVRPFVTVLVVVQPVFQSTHPRGVRLSMVEFGGSKIQVSIHAPPWGATECSFLYSFAYRSFNPRTPVGCDFYRQVQESLPSSFNPRTPVGCDTHYIGTLS